jgi:hypothetical protein
MMLLPAGASAEAPRWQPLSPGVEYGQVGGLHVVRVDATRARLRAVTASSLDKRPRTAAAWCDEQHLVAAINLGMYLDDHLSNVGYARVGAHLNQKRWNDKYLSVLVFGPKKPGLPPAAIVDMDEPGARARLDDYDNAVQNLRLVRAPGRGVWGPQLRRWSESAVAIDRAGRVLFVFSRTAYTMLDFNNLLLKLPLDVVAAMHVEGGPEASLSVRGPHKLDLNGSYETGFLENDAEGAQWAIPNVLGVTTR